MKFLLDTHALLWWLADDDRLGPTARAIVEDPANDILVSVVSLWEIVVKIRVGKLSADISEIADAIPSNGFIQLDIQPAHLTALVDLPMHHRDPFDHFLMAQAIVEDATFVTSDQWALRYPIRIVACSGT